MRARYLLPAALVAAALACGRVVAPPPPSAQPDVSEVASFAGDRLVIAAKAARTLSEFTFNTRRFSSDSTWGYRPADQVAVRLRYGRGIADSTRVLLEMWGECADKSRCNRRDAMALFAAIGQEEGPPP